ncbi:MAG: ABC transporter substrate-binding protein [Deltaproteobacteria bacterium]|nr:ABC transporter substrate-binding protein [Deltaproteobacteria bacterium]MBW1955790.1 ABC transporter substrate-binding protein [Deltaproteobacteria bacterium]MBW2042171.1 ABC transporter substrate-binding protein [Deltaproteobacteria bacterium]MBW2132883.1 ABC transporter substrate-binding protein [Deltaproteobacteria bacterium]
MKRVFTLGLFFLLCGLIGISTVSAKMIRIGEHQIVSHPALDNDSKGFKVALEEEGFIEGKNVVFDRQNAQGEQPNCAIIAQKFEDDRVDLIHAISTPNAQASAKISKTIPIVFSSVTDPVKTGIVPKMGKTGTNITGVSDRWPIALQCRMYQDLVPHAKRWGTIYNPGDVNVTFHIKEMKEAVTQMGGELVEAHISGSAEVMQAAQSLVGRVDAIHITSDNTAVSAFESIVKVCNGNDIPLFVGDRDSVPRGAIAAYGLDYFRVGYTAGKKAARILKGENPGNVPAGLAEGYSLWVSLENAKNQGLQLPVTLIEKAADKLWDEKGKVVKGK